MRVLVTGAARAIGRATVEVLAAPWSRGRGHGAGPPDCSRGCPRPRFWNSTSATTRRCKRRWTRPANSTRWSTTPGLPGSGPLESYPLDSFRRVLEVNTLGPLRVVQAVLPRWRERGSGVLVNVSSVQGKLGTPLEGPYAASKHALEALSETLYFELGHFGIRVVIIEPGYIAPGMKHADDHPGPAVYAELHAQWSGTAETLTGPEGRPGPELVAMAVADALEDPATPLRVEVGRRCSHGAAPAADTQ